MNLKMHQAIAGKLEAGKSAGWLSEYLVAWHGPSGQLEPEVTVWRSCDQNDETVKAYLSGLLGDLVPARDIVIAAVPVFFTNVTIKYTFTPTVAAGVLPTTTRTATFTLMTYP